jgi:hypothetical protein
MAQSIKGPHPVVADVFTKTAAKRSATSLEAIVGDATNDAAVYLSALLHADEESWLKELCVSLINANAVRPEFIQRARELFFRGGAVRPQATFDPYNTSFDPSVDGFRLRQTAPHMCRIDIDGKVAGTGFLVKPHLVLTAYHVVSPLLDKDQEIRGSHNRISIVFDDRRDIRGSVVSLMPAIAISVPVHWLVDSSHCLTVEQLGTDSDEYTREIDAEKGPWDYALIRLEKIASLEHVGLTFGSLSVRDRDPILVFHHPKGKTLVGTRGAVKSVLPQGVRFKHTANTKDGSSGGPCLNGNYEVIGIHQAGAYALGEGRNRVPNRGVPIIPIAKKLVGKLMDPPPELKTIIALDNGELVIGRDDAQQWVWRAVPKEAPTAPNSGNKILVVKGSEGRGRKFTLDIVRTLLSGGKHIVVDLDAGNMVQDTPLTFAQKLLTALHADLSDLPDNRDFTKDLNWLKRTLMKTVRDAIDKIRDDRTVWIGILYPKDGDLPEKTNIRETLDALYGQVKEVDWLRLVLLGLQIDLPEEVVAEATIETLKPLKEPEVTAYFRRRWTVDGKAADDAAMQLHIEDAINSVWGPDPDKPPPDYHKKLVAKIRNLEERIRKLREKTLCRRP